MEAVRQSSPSLLRWRRRPGDSACSLLLPEVEQTVHRSGQRVPKRSWTFPRPTRRAALGAAAVASHDPAIVDGSSTQVAHGGETAEETGATPATTPTRSRPSRTSSARERLPRGWKASTTTWLTRDERQVPIVNLQCAASITPRSRWPIRGLRLALPRWASRARRSPSASPRFAER